MTNLYLDDKIHQHTPINDCLSTCCDAPTNSDIKICGDCKDHCDVYFEDEIDDDTKDEF